MGRGDERGDGVRGEGVRGRGIKGFRDSGVKEETNEPATRPLGFFGAEQEAEVGKFQELGGEEVGGTAKDDEGDGSAEADGDRSAEGINEVHASE